MNEAARNNFPRSVLVGLIVTCAALALLDLAYEKHPHVKFESWFNFYGFFAALAAAALVMLAGLMRSWIGREGDYYDG